MNGFGKFFFSLVFFGLFSQWLLAGSEADEQRKTMTPRSGRKASAFFNRKASSTNLTRQTSVKDLYKRIDPHKLKNRDQNGRTLVHLSAAVNNTDAIYTAVWNGLNVCDLDDFNMSPFHHAAKYGRLEAFLLLLVNGDQSDLREHTEVEYYQDKAKDLVPTLKIIDARGYTIYKYAKDAKDERLYDFLKSIRLNGMITRSGGFIRLDCQKKPEDLSLEEESEESEDADDEVGEIDSSNASVPAQSNVAKSKGCCIVQ